MFNHTNIYYTWSSDSCEMARLDFPHPRAGRDCEWPCQFPVRNVDIMSRHLLGSKLLNRVLGLFWAAAPKGEMSYRI